MTDEEQKAAEEYAKQQARLVWDSWITDATDEQEYEYTQGNE